MDETRPLARELRGAPDGADAGALDQRVRPMRQRRRGEPRAAAATRTISKMILTSLTSGLILLGLWAAGGRAQQQPDSLLLAPADQTVASLQQQQQPMMAQSSNQNQNQVQQRVPRQVEILVQPNAPVRIECRLPPPLVSNRTRSFYWNFQRTSNQEKKPELLAYGKESPTAANFAIDLDVEPASGTYDLMIRNASYELNDGIYYCDYSDSSPDSRQTISREFRLTVLSKYFCSFPLLSSCQIKLALSRDTF